MQVSRQEVVDVLRKTGFSAVADEALQVLPDPVDFDYVLRWGARYGVTRDHLISRMTGGP